MFRLWVKKWKDTHLLEDLVIRDDTQDTRTHKVFHALEKACMENVVVATIAIRPKMLNKNFLCIVV